MFKLWADEKVINSQSPVGEKGEIKTCSECSQIAFRVFIVRSSKGNREVALCGAHYIEACSVYPEMRSA
jgi:hypothetical protein